MKSFLILLSLTLGCATPRVSTTRQTRQQETACLAEQVRMEPEFHVFAEDFYQKAREAGQTCYQTRSILFIPQDKIEQKKDSTGTVIAYCTDTGHIRISKEIWGMSGLLFQKALLFHEMGHCVLGLDHAQEGKLNLMAPYMLSEETLAEYWGLLLQKLFNKSLELSEEVPEDVVFDRHFLPAVQ